MVPVNPPAPSPAPPPAVEAQLTLAQARRLLWRAGFGPAPGQAEALAGQPVGEVVFSLTRPAGAAVLQGPEPHNEEGEALQPADAWGEDHCWWLDRMIRSDQPLVERMTYIWHDWFANSNEKVNDQQRMLDQNNLFREQALGNFHELFLAVTTNPAMLIFLDGIYNSRWEPNENYAREMMELFSLGADRGAYTEDDVREMARALTGWTAEWTESSGLENFHFDAERHDQGVKTRVRRERQLELRRRGRAVRRTPAAPVVLRQQAVELLRPGAATGSHARVAAGAVHLLGLLDPRGRGGDPPVPRIPRRPGNGHAAGRYNAGLLRAVGRYIDTTAWTWLSSAAGQQLFYPPNVSGWDFTRWLDTSTAKARWEMATFVTANNYPNPWPGEGEPHYSETEYPALR